MTPLNARSTLLYSRAHGGKNLNLLVRNRKMRVTVGNICRTHCGFRAFLLIRAFLEKSPTFLSVLCQPYCT
jgi:hypothetical protein